MRYLKQFCFVNCSVLYKKHFSGRFTVAIQRQVTFYALSPRFLSYRGAVPRDVTSERQATMVSEQAVFFAARNFILLKPIIRQEITQGA